MANKRQEREVKAEHDAEVDECRGRHNGGQTYARKVRLLDQIAMLQENAIQAPEHFGK
ncbi:hypothetical protein D3C71_1705410 [compost metagenome]